MLMFRGMLPGRNIANYMMSLLAFVTFVMIVLTNCIMQAALSVAILPYLLIAIGSFMLLVCLCNMVLNFFAYLSAIKYGITNNKDSNRFLEYQAVGMMSRGGSSATLISSVILVTALAFFVTGLCLIFNFFVVPALLAPCILVAMFLLFSAILCISVFYLETSGTCCYSNTDNEVFIDLASYYIKYRDTLSLDTIKWCIANEPTSFKNSYGGTRY